MPLEKLNWRRSTSSGSNGGNCVELAGFTAAAQWRKAKRSLNNGGECVEVAATVGAVVAVRDSKDPDGPVLLLTRAALRTAVNPPPTGTDRPAPTPGGPEPLSSGERRVVPPSPTRRPAALHPPHG